MRIFGLLRAFQEGQDAADAPPDLQGMLLHHLADSKELEFELLGRGWVIHLPEWEPLQLGALTLDFSPTKHIVFVTLAALIVLAVFLPMGSIMKGRFTKSAPTGLWNALEALVLYFRNDIVRRNIGHGADHYTPYILTLFFFILVMNMLGLLPWGATATGNINVTAALALVSFVVIEVSGMRALGFAGYTRTVFFAPPGMNKVTQILIMMILAPVEFLGKLTKPFALAIRLFANMTAGHTLVLSLLGMIFMFANLALAKWAIAGASVGMVLAVMCLELLVALLQAYIFAMLTAVFIGLIRHAH